MGLNYKEVITRNGNRYVGRFQPNGEFMTTFGWTISPEDIKEIKNH